MRIPIRVGIDFYGHLAQPDGSQLATRCFFINYLPLVPLGTYRLKPGAAEKVSVSLKSLFAAFFKAWGFLLAGGIAAYGLLWGSWSRHHDLPVASGFAVLLFLLVYASWLFVGHERRTPLRWGVVGGFTAVTLAVMAYGVSFNLGEMRRHRLGDEAGLPPADIPLTIDVMKAMPDGPKPDELRPAVAQMPLKAGQTVLIELSSGTAMGMVDHATSSDPVEVKTRGGGQKIFRVPRERIYLVK